MPTTTNWSSTTHKCRKPKPRNNLKVRDSVACCCITYGSEHLSTTVPYKRVNGTQTNNAAKRYCSLQIGRQIHPALHVSGAQLEILNFWKTWIEIFQIAETGHTTGQVKLRHDSVRRLRNARDVRLLEVTCSLVRCEHPQMQ